MKTLIFGLFFLSLTNLTTAQNENYLNNVTTKNTVKQIDQLQKKAANFNVKSLESFEKNIETAYNVTFENPNGKIIATYNNEGVIIKTVEVYKNVKSPKQVSLDILKSHPNWIIVGNIFKIDYSSIEKSKKTLNVIVKKGKENQTIHFDLNNKSSEKFFVKN